MEAAEPQTIRVPTPNFHQKPRGWEGSWNPNPEHNLNGTTIMSKQIILGFQRTKLMKTNMHRGILANWKNTASITSTLLKYRWNRVESGRLSKSRSMERCLYTLQTSPQPGDIQTKSLKVKVCRPMISMLILGRIDIQNKPSEGQVKAMVSFDHETLVVRDRDQVG